MAGKCFPLVRGRVMRATRLDQCGRIDDGPCSAIVTDGFVSVALTANITEGEEIVVVNANGRNCVRDTPSPTFNGYGVQITFCDVNPELYAMLTNQNVVFDSFGIAVGFRMNSGIDTSGAGFALEVWSGVPGVACDDPNAAGSYGYVLLPFISGGVLGDFTIENGAVTFTLQNATTRDGSGWGFGPYDVVPTGGTNEKQRVTLTGATGGTYTLTYAGQTTGPIAWNASAAVVQAALAALSNIDEDDVTVTGTGSPWDVTFADDLGSQNVAQMTANGASLTGTTPSATVTTVTGGASTVPGPLLTAIDAKDHLHVQYTTVAPPEPGCDCVASGPAPTGATAGTPGTWTPADSYSLDTLAALQTASPAIVASPTTAWTTGQHIVLGDGSHAHWNSTAWTAGNAP